MSLLVPQLLPVQVYELSGTSWTLGTRTTSRVKSSVCWIHQGYAVDDNLSFTEEAKHEIKLMDDVNLPYLHIPPTQYNKFKEHPSC